MTPPRILIVDDEPDILDVIELTLVKLGLEVDKAGNVGQARTLLDERRYDLCLTDMRMPDGDGLEVVRHVAKVSPSTPVAVITAYGNTENAIAALKAGAFDYLSKPVKLDVLRNLVKTALRVSEAPAPAEEGLPRLIGESPAMKQLKAVIAKLARSQAPVFVAGESGSGKEVAARLIHALGPRAGKPFVAVNCGAIPENLMESEFFGYRKGAFTGADADREGFFQAAAGGTLFLDEVVELPMTMQVKLLRAIQERRVRRVGAVVEEPLDVRIISATHRDLGRAVEEGRFRHDLFYRLNVIEARVPPLRDRREDIPLLARHIGERLAGMADRPLPILSPEAEAALMAYSFPGNVRELENMLERAYALCDGDRILPADLQLGEEGPLPLGREPANRQDADAGLPEPGRLPLQEYLDHVEREAILKALQATNGNKTAAARLLGVSFRSLRYRLERLGIE
ncbi:MAG TPA: sigma-54 dependent transcriptional regulator [Thiobacillaceae bacterium]|nr:sigma-54 dependent transcriptional regulator [Thiobacillaceae bacterium]